MTNTVNLTLETVPKNVVTELGLIVGKNYSIQNISGTKKVYYRERNTDIPAGDPYHFIPPGGWLIWGIDAGFGFWAWTASGTVKISVSEA